MLAKIIDDKKKKCDVFCGTDFNWAIKNGFSEMEVERAWDGSWYLKGFAPERPEPTYTEKRQREYPPISEQLDMIYWDKVNGTNLWQEKIAEIKAKYPKEA
jgi:hypothetical protein